METKQTHTSGALRAAEILGTEFKASPELRLRVLRAADIIDRETAAPEMLEALERIEPSLYNPFEPDNQSAAYRLVKAAIRKAKGEL